MSVALIGNNFDAEFSLVSYLKIAKLKLNGIPLISKIMHLLRRDVPESMLWFQGYVYLILINSGRKFLLYIH